MNIVIQAAREATAQERLIAAAEALAERFEQIAPQVEKLKAVQAKDADLRMLFQREALADVLEALVASTDIKSKPRVTKRE